MPHPSVRRALALASAAVTACMVLVSVTAVPAEASYSTICKGYDSCQGAGYSNAGYKAVSSAKTPYWRMYGGHNCVNYVAYRMVQRGMPNTRPWSTTGDAWNWGGANSSKTNSTPRVGSVAWWGKNVYPVGANGHVAYVERVVSASEIWISEDNWGGDFYWRKVTKSGGGWPSGFIHFKDVLLTNKAKPIVTGTAKIGVKLTAKAGTWTPTGASYAYQWLVNGAAISGAKASTYTPTPGALGKRISVKVTASKLGFDAKSATSVQTAVVAAGTIANTAAPKISGTAKVGQTLTATAGTWSPAGTYTYQWMANGVAVPGATASTLVLGAEQVGKTVTMAASASKAGYAKATKSSAATAVVLKGDAALATSVPTITGTAKVGSTVGATDGAWNATGLTFGHTWMVAGVVKATTPTYKIAAADAGKALTLRVTATRPGYADGTSTSAAKAVAKQVSKTSAKLKSATVKSNKHGSITVTVKATGFTSPTGTVKIYNGKKKIASGTLKSTSKGKITIKLPKLKKGTYYLVAKYAGDTQISGSNAKKVKLKVKKK